MKIRSVTLAASIGAAVAAGCLATEPDPGAAFRVESVEPDGGFIGRTAAVSVLFTRQVREDTLGTCAVAFVPAESFSDTVREAFAREPLSAQAAAAAVCGTVALEGSGVIARFTPERLLRPGGGYRLVVSGAVRDSEGHPLRIATGGAYVQEGEYRISGSPAGGVLVLNEVMANSKDPETRGEWVELFNPADEPVDIDLWQLDFKDGPVQEIGPCGRGTVIPARGYGLVGAETFTVPPVSASVAAGCVKGRLGRKGLVNYAGQVVTLRNPRREAVSSYSGWLASTVEGISVERVDVAGADEPSNWRFSSIDGGTPGAENSRPAAVVVPRAPRLVRIDPNGAEVNPASRFNILYDGPVHCLQDGGCVRIFEDGKGCAGRGGAGGEETYLDNGIVSFAPATPLAAQTAYLIGISGFTGPDGVAAAGYCMPFRTGAAADTRRPRARLVHPADGEADVPPGIRMIEIGFDEAVSMGGRAVAVVVARRETAGSCVDAGAGFVWRCDLDAPLENDAEVAVALTGAAADAGGNLADRGTFGTFWTGSAPDTDEPAVTISLGSAARDGVVIDWSADEDCLFRYSVLDAASGVAVLGGDSGVIARAGESFVGVAIGAREYTVAGYCVDPSGNEGAPAALTLGAADLPPPVVITEVMANPAGTDEGREFIEIANAGSATQAMSGWSIGRCEQPDRAAALGGGASALAAGEYAIVGSRRLLDRGDVPWDARLIETDGDPVAGGLSNTRGERVCLFDQAGAVVSSWGGWLVPPEGSSVERLSLFLPDMATNWVASRASGGTPGRPR